MGRSSPSILSRWTMTAVIGTFLLWGLPGISAFSILNQRPMPCIASSTTATVRHMSDATHNEGNNVGEDSNDGALWMDNLRSTYWKPPPAPEDIFVMIGDLLSLCVYGISDHFFCQVVARMMVRETLADPMHHLSSAAAAQVSSGGALQSPSLQTPVWLDLNTPYTDHVLEINLSNQLVNQYSPLLEPMGAATCLLIACWILAGWLHQAFSFRNTLDCSTERALTVTVQTWLTSCALLFGIVLMSQKLCGCDHFYMLKRGDMDYIVDSASVLILWRFLASYLLGSGVDED